MIQALLITVPDTYDTFQKEVVRALITSHHHTLAAAAVAAFPSELPDDAEAVLLEHTADFARASFPGTTVEVNPDIDLYQATIVDELRHDPTKF
jgi:hypothetical protein